VDQGGGLANTCCGRCGHAVLSFHCDAVNASRDLSVLAPDASCEEHMAEDVRYLSEYTHAITCRRIHFITATSITPPLLLLVTAGSKPS
jgi:hypothetical protein